MPRPNSQTPVFSGQYYPRDTRPQAYQSYSPDGYPAAQSAELPPPYSLNRDEADDSESSLEDEHEPTDDDILAEATEFTRHVPPPKFPHSRLSKPVAIPQTASGIGNAYARCWAPGLAPYNITQSDFVEFIDNLNVVGSASPPLQVLNLVGVGVGMAPHWPFMVAGIGIQAVAKVGTAIVSKSKTDTYMKMVNNEFFGPRGLKARIATREAMAVALNIPNGVEKLSPITDENMNSTTLERRLENLRPYMSELRFDVPPPAQQTTTLAKLSAAQVKWQIQRTEKKALKRRQKLAKEADKRYREESKKLEKRESKLDEKEKKEMKRAREDLRKGRSSKAGPAKQRLQDRMDEIQMQRREVERDFVDKTRTWKESLGDKESKAAKKALWILIEEL